MKTKAPLRRSCFPALVFAFLLAAAPAFAGHHEGQAATPAEAGKVAGPPGGPDPSPESREKLAAAHERMAACLRSTRPMAECRAEMRDLHHAACGGGQCSMGQSCGQSCGHSGGHHGGHHGGHADGHADGQACGHSCGHSCGQECKDQCGDRCGGHHGEACDDDCRKHCEKNCGESCSHGCCGSCPHHGAKHGKAGHAGDGPACEADDVSGSKQPRKGSTAPPPAR